VAINSVPAPAKDDMTTVCAIRLLAAILANVLHEGLGHAATALLTGTKLGVLTTVAWSSDFDSRRVAAGRTLANLAAGMVYWIALRNSQKETQSSGCASFGRGNDALDRFTLPSSNRNAPTTLTFSCIVAVRRACRFVPAN
jgi:hypothetical protein